MASSPVRLFTLGALDLQAADGTELRSVLAQPRRIALLAYLALATPRGPHRRDRLLALFWPDQDESHAHNALSQAFSILIAQGLDRPSLNTATPATRLYALRK